MATSKIKRFILIVSILIVAVILFIAMIVLLKNKPFHPSDVVTDKTVESDAIAVTDATVVTDTNIETDTPVATDTNIVTATSVATDAPVVSQTLFAPSDQSTQIGTVLYTEDFENIEDRNLWSLESHSSWVKEGIDGSYCLSVAVDKQVDEGAYLSAVPFDLTPYIGMKINFTCRVKAENVSKPSNPYLGIKYMLYYATDLDRFWMNEIDVFGTFEWKTLSFSIIVPRDVKDGELCLGLQDCDGKVWFDDLSIVVQAPKQPDVISLNTSAPYKGHDLPRLRGVMSSNTLSEADLKNLGEVWNGNVIRWQLTLNADEYSYYLDLPKYKAWINKKLEELDLALIACEKYGIKVIIDLHSPPGGGSFGKLFYDKTYNDYFIQLWSEIAKRYVGNPTVWAYDLINEPNQNAIAPEGMDYLSTQINAAKAIRAIDSKTAVLFESDGMASSEGYMIMAPPTDVTHVVYEVHMYSPSTYTMQGVDGNEPIELLTYPGFINGHYTDKSTLIKILQPVREFQLKYNVHIYVGEFSVIRWAPGGAQYLKDCIDIFESYGWDWTYHAYREWPGWSVEYDNTFEEQIAQTDTDRKKVLLSWFSKNMKP